MSDLIVALGLAFVLEGVAYALFPAAMQKMMVQVLNMDISNLRMGGLVAATLGVVIVWLVRG